MKLRLIILFLALFITSETINAESTVRILGGIGITSGEAQSSSGSLMNYHLNTQFLFPVSKSFSLGADLGYVHLLTSKYNSNVKSYDYLDVTFVAQYQFWSIICAQAGLGPYYSVGNVLGHNLGIFFSLGVDIPITRTVGIPIFIRTDIAIGQPVLVPFSGMIGLTFHLK